MRDGDPIVPLTAQQMSRSKHGRLKLEFLCDPHGRTYLGGQFSSYPFHICRPFYLDDGPAKNMATVYLQSCSGGLYTEDSLRTSITAGPGAQAHVTTQASTIVHQSARGPACQQTEIKVAEGALLEFTPDPIILFPGAHLRSSLQLSLADTASAIVFDSFLAHDYRGRSGVFDLIENDLSVSGLNGEPLAIDRFRFSGADFAAALTGQMGSYACHGSFLAIAPQADIAALLAASRSAVAADQDSLTGVSLLPDERGISARILSKDAVGLKSVQHCLWEVSRQAITGKFPRHRKK